MENPIIKGQLLSRLSSQQNIGKEMSNVMYLVIGAFQ